MNKELNDFKLVCKVSELTDATGQRFLINDVDVALFKVEGKIYALNNFCTHKLMPKIYEGNIEDGYVICPLHGWQFNLKDGKLHNGTTALDTYETKIIDDDVYVKTYDKKLNW
ncbi:MAG: nitrite reductase [Ignavibacteriae bacterium]|nr:MAG: nitrite reductase [Ignavibacteriota bacterium]